MTRRGLLAGLALMSATRSKAQTVLPQSFAATELPWTFLADTVMGGVSRGQLEVRDGALRLFGTVSTANNGGFIQARSPLEQGLPAEARRLVVTARGQPGRYAVHLRSLDGPRPWEYYRSTLAVAVDWSDIMLPLSEFERSRDTMPETVDPQRVRSFGFVASGANFEADVSLRTLRIEG